MTIPETTLHQLVMAHVAEQHRRHDEMTKRANDPLEVLRSSTPTVEVLQHRVDGLEGQLHAALRVMAELVDRLDKSEANQLRLQRTLEAIQSQSDARGVGAAVIIPPRPKSPVHGRSMQAQQPTKATPSVLPPMHLDLHIDSEGCGRGKDAVCDECFTRALCTPCPRCGGEWYCSAKCQLARQDKHKQLCRAICNY